MHVVAELVPMECCNEDSAGALTNPSGARAGCPRDEQTAIGGEAELGVAALLLSAVERRSEDADKYWAASSETLFWIQVGATYGFVATAMRLGWRGPIATVASDTAPAGTRGTVCSAPRTGTGTVLTPAARTGPTGTRAATTRATGTDDTPQRRQWAKTSRASHAIHRSCTVSNRHGGNLTPSVREPSPVVTP
jgi:hypothetical protein